MDALRHLRRVVPLLLVVAAMAVGVFGGGGQARADDGLCLSLSGPDGTGDQGVGGLDWGPAMPAGPPRVLLPTTTHHAVPSAHNRAAAPPRQARPYPTGPPASA